MRTLRLHVWREWREHRATLLFLSVALPLLSGLAALRLPRRFVGDPWMACGLIAIFVVVVLAAVGGELLGRERRGTGLRWLERLPGGLGQAFVAKLGLHLATSVVAGLAGFALAQLFAWLRGRGDFPWTIELEITLPLVAMLSAWTFACSAWALRGGTAILAAGLGLGLAAYPVLNVLQKGCQPSGTELVAGTGLTVVAGLVSAALGFLFGSRLGAGQGRATAFGLLPLPLLAGLGGVWSLDQLERRARIDPTAGDFRLHYSWITADASTAFLVVQHEDPRWTDAMPLHVLAVDLNTGAWRTRVREYSTYHELSAPAENGLLRPNVLVLNSELPPHETAISLEDGGPAKEFRDLSNSRRVGLGQHQWSPSRSQYWDPFRMRGYTDEEIEGVLGIPTGNIFICPGRWLVEKDQGWHAFDPDTRTLERLGTPPYSELLALLPDGRAIFQQYEIGLFCFDARTGSHSEIAAPVDTRLSADRRLFQAPIYGYESPMSLEDSAVLYLKDRVESALYALDTETLSLRSLPPESEPEWFVGSFPDGRALLETKTSLIELDLRTGERRQIFPRRPES